MKRIKNENGYALVVVLALLTIASIFMLPYLNSFLHDTQEIKIETLKTQNNYTLESAVEITKSIIEENNIMAEEELVEVIDTVVENSESLFTDELEITIDTDLNQLVFATNNQYLNSRTDSKLSFVYRTFDLASFDNYPIIIGERDPKGRVKGNSNFIESYAGYEILGISDELFAVFTQSFFEEFESKFTISEIDHFYHQLDVQLDENLILNNLWIDGDANIEGKKNGKSDIVIYQDFYVGGDISISKIDNFVVHGDLVVYGGSLELKNIDNIDIKGNLIVNGAVSMTGNSEISLKNIAADKVSINSSNQDVFYLYSDTSQDKEKGKKKDNDNNKKPRPATNFEYIDGRLIIESWKLE